MKLSITLLILPIFLIAANPTIAQTSKSISNFSLLNTVDNNQLSLSNFQNKKGVVIIFTSNFCPYSKLYEERIEALANEFSGKGVQFILINPNNPMASKDDSIEEMAKQAREKGFSFPYLADKDQQVANSLGATKTPEVYLLKPVSGSFSIVYSGAIDDNPQVPGDVNKAYLKEAINNHLSGKPIAKAFERPTGCMIKKK